MKINPVEKLHSVFKSNCQILQVFKDIITKIVFREITEVNPDDIAEFCDNTDHEPYMFDNNRIAVLFMRTEFIEGDMLTFSQNIISKPLKNTSAKLYVEEYLSRKNN